MAENEAFDAEDVRCDTLVHYMYRDAGNYKFYGEFFLTGRLKMSEIQNYLFNGEFFVPNEIGVPSLVPSKKMTTII